MVLLIWCAARTGSGDIFAPVPAPVYDDAAADGLPVKPLNAASKFANAWLLVLDDIPNELIPVKPVPITVPLLFTPVPPTILLLIPPTDVVVPAVWYDILEGFNDDAVIPLICDEWPVVLGCSNSAKIRLSCCCFFRFV